MNRGLLISFDGLDSSGKATQTKHLADRLRYLGWSVRELQSPDYTTDTGRMLKDLFQDTTGKWQRLTWEEKMRLFAANRLEHKPEVEAALSRGEIILYDRYVMSSVAFITIEALDQHMIDLYRDQVQRTITRHEYEHNGMPREDVAIFLDVSPTVAYGLLERRKEKLGSQDEYTDHMMVQRRLYNEYDWLCQNQPTRFIRIRCQEGDRLLGIDDIAELVWQGLLVKFPHLEHPKQVRI